jgi:hypothetical protein
MTRSVAVAGALSILVGCGASSAPSPGVDSGVPDATSSDSGTAPPEAGNDASCGPGSPTPGQVRCGTTQCATPAEVCCYDQGGPRCATAASCNASSIACEESTDCAPTGSYCCSATGVLQPDASFSQVTVVTFCTTDPTMCLPQPGVGNSSVLACEVDSECAGTGSTCVSHVCDFGQCVRLCGPSGTGGCT